jgi:hypothetical protein
MRTGLGGNPTVADAVGISCCCLISAAFNSCTSAHVLQHAVAQKSSERLPL